MPPKLSEPIEEQIRKYVINNVRPAEIQGYDPTQSDTTASDFILVTSDNDNYGDYYPLIYVSKQDNGATIPNSGTTNANGKQGDGSGNNQYYIQDVTIQAQAVENGPYLNNTDYDQLVFDLYQELEQVFNSVPSGDFTDFINVGELTPGTLNRSSDEQDNSTETWAQMAGTVPVAVQKTP